MNQNNNTTLVLKTAGAIAAIIGIVLGLFQIIYAPHSLLAESSPDAANWLPWVTWSVASVGTSLYIAVDISSRLMRNEPAKPKKQKRAEDESTSNIIADGPG